MIQVEFYIHFYLNKNNGKFFTLDNKIYNNIIVLLKKETFNINKFFVF